MRKIDYDKPLSAEDVAYLQERLPNEQVSHLVARAGGTQEDATALIGSLVDPEGALAAARAAEGGSSDSSDESAMKEGDDPDDFNVAQVNAHLESASDEEKERVLQAERDGQARKGIVGES